MSQVRFPIALLAAVVLGWAIGQAHADPFKWQATILLMPKSGEGIITGVQKKFLIEKDCQEWLKNEMRQLELNRAFRSTIDPHGVCNGR